MSFIVGNRSSGFPTRSNTKRAVQPQKMARGLKFRTKVAEGLYYPCGENKGADQLCGHPVFSQRDSYMILQIMAK